MKGYRKFALIEALLGKELITRAGVEVTEIILSSTMARGRYPIAATVNGVRETYTEKGEHYHDSEESPIDLFMAPETYTGYAILWCDGSKSKIHDTREEAEESTFLDDYNSIVEVSWEC